ncbi:LysM peptidoglycan-binding domain-containing protein [Hydrotalea sp.]|uniref:LysM peptidoglycan-binding domain-containing protein n=1 Tax=Hydrotalea sp. TaxID=2881279 RepID=UPI00260ED2D2|nr:LysM peptidoglycan-binding domain-containing protein [Hydrotalea sp.]
MNASPILKATVCSLLLLVFASLQAQTNQPAVEHVIKKGETLSALAHQYHITVGDIMRLNGMNSKSVLHIGEKVKIPVKGGAAKQKAVSTVTPSSNTQSPKQSNALIHVVGQKETLYAISKKYKVTVAQIQQWNHLTSTNIHTGQKLIIGATIAEPVVTTVAEPATQQTTAPASAPVKTTPANTTTAVSVNQNMNANTTSVDNNTHNNQAIPVNNSISNTDDDIPAGGFFTDYYKPSSGQSISGDASIFKTASGWMDKKYYVLVNNIPEGTIVKIESNQKVVYAKVLGALPNIKEDDGLLMRISNAAAAVLGMADKRFPVTVQY